MHKTITIIVLLLVAVFFVKSPVHAITTTDWKVPNRFAGMNYPGTNWSNITNIAGVDDTNFASVDVQFGNPAPQIWYQSLGFDFGEVANYTVSKVEVDVRVKKRYNVSPNESLTFYLVAPDGDVVSALNPPPGSVYVIGSMATFFNTYHLVWQDTEEYPRVSQYFQYFKPSDFTIVIGAVKDSTSGSTNFIDLTQMKMRLTYSANDITAEIPNISRTWLATENLKAALMTKAPFGYIAPVLNLQLSEQTDQGFTISIPIVLPESVGGTQIYSATLENTAAFNGIKTVLSIAMTGAFVFYLLRLMGRVTGTNDG